jgi:hypothetical protein
MGVRPTVEMVCAADVVSWNDGDEGGGTVGTGGLHTAESIGVDSGGRAITIALCLNARVDTSSVASPHLDISVSDRLAR